MTTRGGQFAIAHDRLVLVEGMDEVNLIERMLDTLGIKNVQIIEAGGVSRISERLKAVKVEVETKRIDLISLAVLRDADTSAPRAFQSVTGALRSSGFDIPSAHGAFSQGSPSVGVFILPDGEAEGSVEDLCWQAVQETPAGRCSQAYVECLQGLDTLTLSSPSKTLVHAYLAAQDDPSTRVGEGAQKGYWPLDDDAFARLKDFLTQLASIQVAT